MPVKIRNPHTHSSDHPDSYYVASANALIEYEKLDNHIQTDVCVIGGGFSGINTAIELAEKGYRVVVLEAFKVGWGASGRNGGQLIRGIGHDVEKFENEVGKEGVRILGDMGLEAVEIVKARVKRFDIDCDLKLGYADVAHKQRDMAALKEELNWLEKVDYKYETKLINKAEAGRLSGTSDYIGGLVDKGSGHLHPLNLVLGEAHAATTLGVKIYENSCVESIDYGEPICVRTDCGSVTADNLVICANAYGEGLSKELEKKVLPCGSYIIATEPLPNEIANKINPENYALCDMRVALDYFRLSADNRLLFGGRCNYSGKDPKNIAASMRPKMDKLYPILKDINIEYAWGGMSGIGANRLPQIGRLRNNVYYAQAYCGHGVNTTHLAAKVLAEAIDLETSRIDVFEKIKHFNFPGGPILRSPLLAIGMSWFQLKDLL